MYKYIIVDDEYLMRKSINISVEALEMNLEYAGEAEDGEEAIELIQKTDSQIIFTDMRMPAMDGKLLLNTIKESFADKKVIVISGYSDFEYTREAINANVMGYLLKPFSSEELRQVLEKTISQIESEKEVLQKISSVHVEREKAALSADIHFLSSLVYYPENSHSLKELKSLKLTHLNHAKNYMLYAVYVNNKLDSGHITNLCSVANCLESCVMIPHPSSDKFLLFLFASTDSDSSRFDRKISSNIKALEEVLCSFENHTFLTAKSFIKNTISDLNEMYKSVIAALNSSKVVNTLTMQISKSMPDINSKKPETVWEKDDILFFSIEAGNTSEVPKLLVELFTAYSQNTNITIGDIKARCKYYYDYSSILLNKYYDISVVEDNRVNFQKIMSTCFDMNSLKIYLQQFLINVSTFMAEKKVYLTGDLVLNIKTYIENNYFRRITLEKVSSMFYANPNYICSIFKDKVGITFADYITKMRIDKAMELLVSTDQDINHIAKVVGYDNTKYFYRVFKKVTGKTPVEYKTYATRSNSEVSK